MKRIKLLAITLVLSIGFFSCSDSTLNGPEPDNNSSEYSNSFQKENPLNKTLSFNDNKVISKIINGKTGGVINLSAIYKISSPPEIIVPGKKVRLGFNVVTATAVLIIPPGAFEGIREITLIDDYKTASIYCYPSMTFDKPVYMNLIFTGLDLASLGFTKDNVKFGYAREDGTIDPCINDGITLNNLRGAVGVVRARIEHFSRYMFSR